MVAVGDGQWNEDDEQCSPMNGQGQIVRYRVEYSLCRS